VKRVFGLEGSDLAASPRVVTVGAFDGVHLGHVRTLHYARREARQRDAETAAVTFDPSPRELEDGVRQPGRRLTPVNEQLCLLQGLALDLAVVLEFPGTIQEMEPEDFVREVLVGRLNAVCVCASESHRFGAGGRGDLHLLRDLGGRLGFAVTIAQPDMIGGRRVSSTWVRELLAAGQANRAAALLGRPYALFGEVVEGRGRGRQLGFPTANLCIPPEKVLPRDGVYAGVAAQVTADYDVLEQPRPAAINIGTAPTFGREQRAVEVHVLGGEAHLAGACVKVQFLRWLRPERTFPDEDALVRQIREDVTRTEAAAGAAGRPPPDGGSTLRQSRLPSGEGPAA